MDRSIAFEGISNCRDLGGLPGAAGRRIRPGQLYRAAHLGAATEADRAKLRRLGVTLTADLRTDLERQQKPDRLPEGMALLPRPIFDEVTAGITREDGTPAPLIMPDMEALYRVMVTAAPCRESLRAVLVALMERAAEGEAVLWHCTAGKDRCGVVSALLLAALGAKRETIMADYLVTNEISGPESRAVYQKLLAEGFAEEDAARVREVFLAKESYLNAALDAAEEEYGSLEAYLHRGLELESNLLRRFRARMLA